MIGSEEGRKGAEGVARIDLPALPKLVFQSISKFNPAHHLQDATRPYCIWQSCDCSLWGKGMPRVGRTGLAGSIASRPMFCDRTTTAFDTLILARSV